MRAADVVAHWREHAKENAHSWQAYVSVTSPNWTPRGERSDLRGQPTADRILVVEAAERGGGGA